MVWEVTKFNAPVLIVRVTPITTNDDAQHSHRINVLLLLIIYFILRK